MDFFFGAGARRASSPKSPVFNKKTGKPIVVDKVDWKKNKYYTKGKSNASVVKQDRKSGRKTTTTIKFKREADKIYYVNRDGLLMQSPKAANFR